MSCSILATWPYASSLMKACKKQKLEKPGQQSIGGSKKDSSIFKLPEMLKSCSVLGYSDYLLPRSNISAMHVDTVRRCNGKRTIACNLWNSYSSWCFLRRIHWKTPKRRRMHQSRSRRWDHVTKYFVFQAPHKAETTWNNAVSFVFEVAELPSAPLRSFSSEAPWQDWEYYECILMHLI